jgi:hypothetical protein
MQLLLRVGGQIATVTMDQAGEQTVLVGEHTYRIARMAQRVRKLATRMWGGAAAPAVLDQRLTFEATESYIPGSQWGDSGSFSPVAGATVALGRWDEDATVAIALHELAHEMHMRAGGYDESDGIMREALALLAEREAGLKRDFDREPYYTASNLVAELCELPAFARMPFPKRWEEVVPLQSDLALADLVNFYLDRSERLGLARWLKRYSDKVELRDALLYRVAACSLRYSLDYRRKLLASLVRCPYNTPLEQICGALDAVMALDKRYPDDDLSRIIAFCFAPVTDQKSPGAAKRWSVGV